MYSYIINNGYHSLHEQVFSKSKCSVCWIILARYYEWSKQTNNKSFWILDLFFVLGQYIHDDNLHPLTLYPVGSSCSVSRERLKWYAIPLITAFSEVQYTCCYNCRFFGAAGEFAKQITQLFSLKSSRIHATHMMLFSSDHFKLKQNFNIFLEYPINAKYFNSNKKMYDILSTAI